MLFYFIVFFKVSLYFWESFRRLSLRVLSWTAGGLQWYGVHDEGREFLYGVEEVEKREQSVRMGALGWERRLVVSFTFLFLRFLIPFSKQSHGCRALLSSHCVKVFHLLSLDWRKGKTGEKKYVSLTVQSCCLYDSYFLLIKSGFCIFEICDGQGKNSWNILRFLPQLLSFLVDWADVLIQLKTPKRQSYT